MVRAGLQGVQHGSTPGTWLVTTVIQNVNNISPVHIISRHLVFYIHMVLPNSIHYFAFTTPSTGLKTLRCTNMKYLLVRLFFWVNTVTADIFLRTSASSHLRSPRHLLGNLLLILIWTVILTFLKTVTVFSIFNSYFLFGQWFWKMFQILKSCYNRVVSPSESTQGKQNSDFSATLAVNLVLLLNHHELKKVLFFVFSAMNDVEIL